MQRYPDSPYAKQADNRIRIAEDTLAAAEMNVGRYYQKRNNHVARHQPLQDGGHRVPDHRARGRGALPPGGNQYVAGHRARGPDRRRRARPQLPELAMVHARPRAAEVRRRQPADQPGHLDRQHPERADPGLAAEAAAGAAAGRHPRRGCRRPRTCRRRGCRPTCHAPAPPSKPPMGLAPSQRAGSRKSRR